MVSPVHHSPARTEADHVSSRDPQKAAQKQAPKPEPEQDSVKLSRNGDADHHHGKSR